MPLYKALIYLKEKVEKFLSSSSIQVHLDCITRNNANGGVYVSLLYAEEEKTLKNNEYIKANYKTGQKTRSNILGYSKVNPKLYLNLHVLITSTQESYEEGLKQISKIIAGFTQKNVYSNSKEEGGDFGSEYKSLEKLTLDIETLTFEQNNSLWQTLGTKLYPYVLYRVRVIAFSPIVEENVSVAPVKKVFGLVEPYNYQRADGVHHSPDSTSDDVSLTDEEKNAVKNGLKKIQSKTDYTSVSEENIETIVHQKDVLTLNSSKVYEAIKKELHK